MERIEKSIDGMLHFVPRGASVEAMHDLVSDDLVPESGLAGLLRNSRHFGDSDPLLRSGVLPRIRPVLVAVAARAAGASEVDGETQYAAELLHLALIVHDLALGREGGRRRRLARRVIRKSMSVVAGNVITLRALELGRTRGGDVLEALVDTLREFQIGQELARELHERPATFQDWREHSDAHTGALFSFCCGAGGHLAHADPIVVSGLTRYGRHLGRLWHIAEDVSALRGPEAGPHLVARALAGRAVLPVILAADIEPTIADQWMRLVHHPDVARADALAERVRAVAGPSRAAEQMLKESWTARRALRTLPDTRYRTALERLAFGIAKAGVRSDPLP